MRTENCKFGVLLTQRCYLRNADAAKPYVPLRPLSWNRGADQVDEVTIVVLKIE